MRLTRARLLYVRDGDPKHFKELEDAKYPGLWWPESDKFKNLLEATAETCEKFEAGVLTGDEAADIVLKHVQDSDIVNPTFGWKDPNRRFVSPSTFTMARFMYWASVQGPPEMRHLGREFLKGILKAGSKVRKLL